MVNRIVAGIVVLMVSACAAGSPSLPGSETVDRARDVAEQLDDREGDLMDDLEE